MVSPISALKQGHAGKISSFTDEQIAGKLMTMGVLPGSFVKLVRVAPFKGGYYLKVDGMVMVVREKEASTIVLEVQ
ncbi:MAG: ferrous iron transport protein A [Lewinellaceae bacterium]|nr:ferrous iron transport protein A [Saprospiraceae bacterium]MCB9337118.1 ferrous iron transport protein A [Lewinellaceae bacterium]